MKSTGKYTTSYKLARALACGTYERKFNYHHPVFEQDLDTAYIVVSNHNTDYDPILLAAAFPEQMFFVAAENVMHMGFASTLIERYFKPILRVKGKKETRTVAEILRTLRSGRNVCIFAEGNRSFNGRTGYILPSTGKMIRKSGAAMVTYKLSGAYFTQPRWGKTLRKGRIDGSIQGVYTAEELSDMSDDEINAIINRDLYEDAYQAQAQEPIAFKGKQLALGLERALFYCPACGRFGSLHSDDNYLSCECGNRVKYTEEGYLAHEDGQLDTITEWDELQQESLKKEFYDKLGSNSTEPVFFDEYVKFSRIDANHNVVSEVSGCLRAYCDRMELGELVVPYSSFEGISIFKSNILILNFRDDEGELCYYQLHGPEFFCALKYEYLFNIATRNT